jgi:hypothetical protein
VEQTNRQTNGLNRNRERKKEFYVLTREKTNRQRHINRKKKEKKRKKEL